MDYFYSAAMLRSRGALWPIFAPALITGIEPQLIEIEVSENVLMQHSELAVRAFQTLSNLGVRVTIDNFGTGYSRLSTLAALPLHALKIDQSFVRHVSTTPQQKTIVGTIVSLARSLGLRVIAEGVETAEELAFLKNQNCDEAQGHFFSRALPAHRLMRVFGD